MVGKDILEDPDNCRLANTQRGSNLTSGLTIAGQSNNVFFLGRGDRVHGRIAKALSGLSVLKQLQLKWLVR